MASVGFVSEVGVLQRRRPTKLRRTVYLTVMIVTLTASLYSLRDIRRAEGGLVIRPDSWSLSKADDLRVRTVRQADGDSGSNQSRPTDDAKVTAIKSTSTVAPVISTTASHSTRFFKILGIDFLSGQKHTTTTTDGSLKPQGSTVATKVTTSLKTTTGTTSMTSTTVGPSSTERLSSSSSSTVASTATSTTIKMRRKTTTAAESSTQPMTTATTLPTVTSTQEFCEAPAYREFPADVFTDKQRTRGAVVIHILIGVYMFYALAVVCDEYFVAAMEKMCDSMGLSEDVAGATFMAAGSSAPELFASLLGVFVARGDVGTGTIVGSAVFNVLFVIGFCAYFCGRVNSFA